MTADKKLFCEIPGVGIAKYVELQAISEVGRRFAKEALIVGDVLKNTQATYRYLTAKMKNYRREVFACLFLNSANHLFGY